MDENYTIVHLTVAITLSNIILERICNGGVENDGPSKLQCMKLQDMILQDMTNISLLLFLPIPVILSVLWKIWGNIYS